MAVDEPSVDLIGQTNKANPPGSSPRNRNEIAGEEPTDLDLVKRLRESDATALAALYDRYAGAVHGLTRSVLRDDRQAEEATHDVFLGLWQNPRSFDAARGGFAPWLLRVARNRAIDLLRRRREQPFASYAVTDAGQTIDPVASLIDPDPDPADQAVSRMAGQDVRRALSCLAPELQRLLEMAYFGGMTQREIALAVNRPLGTVKTQIRTAMQRMADLLSSTMGKTAESTVKSAIQDNRFQASDETSEVAR